MLIDKKTKEVLRGVSLGLLLVSSVAVQSRREARELLRCFAKQKNKPKGRQMILYVDELRASRDTTSEGDPSREVWR